tara:strand:- start:1629 stop:1832 length:204 start_codon:yes stop_codon:yes gene_type:complete
MSDKINLVDGKQVAIIKSYPHTYHVRFVKSGKFLEIKKEYVKSWYPKSKKAKPKPKPENPQQKINFN